MKGLRTYVCDRDPYMISYEFMTNDSIQSLNILKINVK